MAPADGPEPMDLENEGDNQRAPERNGESWRDVAIPGFDEMVAPGELFALCACLGDAIFRGVPGFVGFVGPARSGKTVMCNVVRAIAMRNDVAVHTVADGDRLAAPPRLPAIIIAPETGLAPLIAQPLAAMVTPVFFTSLQPVLEAVPRVRVFHFPLAVRPDPHLFESIERNIALVERKCRLAARERQFAGGYLPLNL